MKVSLGFQDVKTVQLTRRGICLWWRGKTWAPALTQIRAQCFSNTFANKAYKKGRVLTWGDKSVSKLHKQPFTEVMKKAFSPGAFLASEETILLHFSVFVLAWSMTCALEIRGLRSRKHKFLPDWLTDYFMNDNFLCLLVHLTLNTECVFIPSSSAFKAFNMTLFNNRKQCCFFTHYYNLIST